MLKSKRLLSVLFAIVMLIQTLPLTGFAADVEGFVDFPTGSWSEEAMTAAVDNGLIVGTSETTIEPKKNLTRAEFAAIVTRAFGATEKADISKFKDVDADQWYAEPVAKVVQMGVMQGTGATTFDPNAYMKREDVILALARVLFVDGNDTSVLNQFSDRDKIDSWSVKAIAGMVNEGYVNGYEDGTIRPLNYITREELAQLFHNIFKTYISEDGEFDSVAKKGSVIVRSKYVTLKDVTIDGDLIMADGIGDGDFRISNVHVTGKIIARGGEGMNYFVNVTSDGKVIVNDPNGTVNFYNYREEDTPFKGGNVIENTPATFLEREPAKPSIGGGGPTAKYDFFVYVSYDDMMAETNERTSVKNKSSSYRIKDDDVPSDAEMEALAPAGYVFKGWLKKDSVEGVKQRDYLVGKSIKEVNGVWYPYFERLPGEYTITFVTPEGEVPVEKTEGETIDASEIPSITVDESKEFLGWTKTDGSTSVDFTNDELTADVVENVFDSTEVKLYPVIKDRDVTEIVFKHPDGDVKVTKYDDPDYVLVDSDVPADPSKADHTFKGWAKDPAATEGEERDYFIGKKISEVEGTWYPIFEEIGESPVTYTVSFKYTDNSEALPTVEKSLTSSEDYVLTSADVKDVAHPTAPADYEFLGWTETVDGTDYKTSAELQVSVKSLNGKTYYAQFEKVTDNYTVVFKYTDGTEINKVEKTLSASEDYTLTSSDVSDVDYHTNPADYTFLGWTDTVDGTDYKTSAELQVSIKDLDGKTYYAQYERNETTYTVSFKYEDGSEALPTVEKNLVASEDYVLTSADVYDVEHPTAPADYKFIGWSKAGSTTVVPSEELEVSIRDLDGKTYYAQFEKVTDNYTVVFKYTDGTEINKVEKTLSASEDYTLTSSDVSDVDYHTNPADYTFLGWTDTVDGTDYKTSAELQVSIKDLDGKTYYAQYERNETTYTVSFKYEDGSEALPTVEKNLVASEDYVLTNADVYDVEHPTAPADYKFIGWSEAGSTTVVPSEELEVSIRDLDGKTYYAQFEKVTDNYTVVFKYTDGTEINKVEKTLSASEDYTLTSSDVSDVDYHTNPADYTFLGWTDTVDGTDYKTSAELQVSIKDLDGKTYYAQYERNETTYTVSFKYEDGSEALPTVEKNLVASEDYVLTSADVYDVEHPTAPADYKFIGWSKAGSTTVVPSEELEVSIRDLDGKTYYAQFEKVTDNYTVVFKYTDGTEINKVEKTLSASEDYTLTSSDVSDVDYHTNPADYTFLGWTDTVDGTDYKTSAELQVSIKDLDGKTYYAQYERNETTYTVSFKYEDGSEALPTVEKNLVASEDYVLTNADVYDVEHPTAPADYKFIGWSEAGSTTVVPSEELEVSIRDLDGKTYYAQFEKVTDNYTVVFKYTDGTEINKVEKTLSASEDYTLTSSDVSDVDYHTNPADYTFLGWTDTVDGTDYKTSAELQVSIKDLDGKTYYAQYERNETTYTVSFKYEDGSEALPTVEKNLVASEDYVLTNADVYDVEHPTAPADYKFIGWSEAGSTTVVLSEDLEVSIRDLDGKTYYAQFEEIEKPVTYKVEFKYTDGSEALPTVEKSLLDSEDYVLTESDVYDVVYPGGSLDYEFLGWTDTVDGTDYKTSAELRVSVKDLDGTVYYAQFKEIERPVDYKVEFKYTDGSEALSAVEKSLLDAEDYVLTNADVYDVEYFEEPEMYEFLGWTEAVDGTDYMTSAELQVSIKTLGAVYYAQFKHVDEVLYKVEHYFEQLDGTYVLETTEELYEYPGIDVTATALTTLPEGYDKENEDHADRVAEGTVLADGSLTLKLYYDLKVITVRYYDLAVDTENPAWDLNGDNELVYSVKYGGTIDNFYYPDDEFDATVNEEIKAEIAEYIEYIKIAGYGKEYDDEYLYSKFEDELDGDYYPMYPHFNYDYEHEINFKWYVEDDVEEFVVFDEDHVFTEDLNLYSKIKKLNVEFIFPEKLTEERLTLNIPYEESTRFLDSIRDALFINDNIATFPNMTGVEEKFYDKMSNVGGRVFGDDGVFNDEYEINNTDIFVYFYQMMGGKASYRKWLWEEVETEVENSLGPRGKDKPRSQYESLRTMGLNQEQALYTFFEENYFGLDFTGELAFAYGRYVDSKRFINDSTNKDQFVVTVNNDFIMEKVEEKVSSLASVDSVIAEYGGGRVPEGLLNRLPMDIVEDIYEPRIQRFLNQLEEARYDAAHGEPEENCMVDSGILFDVNLVEELLIPGMEFAEESHTKAVNKAKNSNNKAAELIEKYYVDNPYTTGAAGNYGAVNYAFNPYFYVEDTDGDGFYTIRSFEAIYNDVVMPESVESIDALLWFMDPEGGAVDFAKIRNLAEENEALILALHNHPNNLMAKYAVEGLPENMSEYWEDLLSDPEIKAAVEKLDNKVSFDMMYFVESKIQNETLKMYYLKVLDKAGVPVENILSKYTNSKAYKELTSADFNKLLDQIEECWETVDVDGVPVVNANGTTDYVFDNVLEKVGSSGDVAQASIKGFEVVITRFFADDLFQVAP